MSEKISANPSFSWGDLGDIETGRPNLGQTVPVAVYRLLQFTMREAVRQAFDAETAREMLVRAGRLAGREFCRNLLDRGLETNRFIALLQQTLREWGIGILRVEKADFDRREFLLTVAEDLDCSGLKVSDETVCDFDEGFIAGIFQEYTGEDFEAREIDCWASGERVCRFRVGPLSRER